MAYLSVRGCVKVAPAAKGSIHATSKREICTTEYISNSTCNNILFFKQENIPLTNFQTRCWESNECRRGSRDSRGKEIFHARGAPLTSRRTQKCRFMDKEVREISRFFVAPPCSLPLSVWRVSRTSLPIILQSLVQGSWNPRPCVTFHPCAHFAWRTQVWISSAQPICRSNYRQDERREKCRRRRD